MGYLRHHTIIVSGWQNEKVVEARNKAVEIFNEAFKGYPLSELAGEVLVSPIMGSIANGQSSFFIAPDGSKEGWEPSNMGDNAREEFINWLKEGREKDDHYLDYVELYFGGDDEVVEIENSSTYCEYNDEEDDE